MKPKSPHGGERKDAGRPAKDGAEGLRRVSVMLTDKHIAAAKKLGDGELSLGIRRALSKGS